MVGRFDRVVLRKVDVVSFESDAWRQASEEFEARGIPLFAVYDAKGARVGTVPGANVAALEALVKKALAR